MAREEHRVGEDVDFLGEESTVADLGRYRDVAATRRMQPMRELRPYTTDHVRRIIDGEEPVPSEVAPETVAALGLIWWRLKDR